MDKIVVDFLKTQGYECNTEAMNHINACNAWYANKNIPSVHNRKTINGVAYSLDRLGFAKRCCSDDANLCEVVEVNASKKKKQNDFVNEFLRKNKFDTMFRQQVEKTSALGTSACYVGISNAQVENDKVVKGDIYLNYVDADGYIPLTVVNNDVIEAAFAGQTLRDGKKEYVVVVFKFEEGKYHAYTFFLNEEGKEKAEKRIDIQFGEVKPFAIYRTAEVNNLEEMGEGYGLPKIWNAIPHLKSLDLAYNVLFTDLDKGEKILIVNDLLCEYSNDGKIVMTPEQKKLFVMTREKLPEQKDLIHEYNPQIRIDQLRDVFELVLSMLSTQFGYGSKKYSLENGKITTATEYIGARQDAMQELNKQRFEVEQYIKDIVRAVLWFSNEFQGSKWNIDDEVIVTFDDSYIVDKEAELERKRNDALSFDIPQLKVWYLMDAYNLTEDEALAMVSENKEEEEPDIEE